MRPAGAASPTDQIGGTDMPDVHFWYRPGVYRGLAYDEVKAHLRRAVATQMDCFDDKRNWIRHDPETHIVVLTFAPLDNEITDDAIIHVMAYDWPDRMRNIPYRMETIGREVAGLIEAQHPKLKRAMVSASFIPIPQGCWVRV